MYDAVQLASPVAVKKSKILEALELSEEGYALAQQQQVATTLGELVHDVTTHRISSPAIVLVGEVCRLAALSPASQTQWEGMPTMATTRSA
jgi:hypothetical protein